MGNPTYMYRLKDGAVEAKVFDSDALPEGWVDSPAKVEKEPKITVKKKHGNRA